MPPFYITEAKNTTPKTENHSRKMRIRAILRSFLRFCPKSAVVSSYGYSSDQSSYLEMMFSGLSADSFFTIVSFARHQSSITKIREHNSLCYIYIYIVFHHSLKQITFCHTSNNPKHCHQSLLVLMVPPSPNQCLPTTINFHHL